MTKLKTFFRRLFAGSFKRMFGYIGTIHKETGKNRFIMFFDMIWCISAILSAIWITVCSDLQILKVRTDARL